MTDSLFTALLLTALYVGLVVALVRQVNRAIRAERLATQRLILAHDALTVAADLAVKRVEGVEVTAEETADLVAGLETFERVLIKLGRAS